MSLCPTICRGSSCGGLPSAGTIQPRCCPHGCLLRVITASNPEVLLRPKLWLAGEPGISGRRGAAAPMRNPSAAAVAKDLRASYWSLPPPFLGLELRQDRALGGRADPVAADVHIVSDTAPHHAHTAAASA